MIVAVTDSGVELHEPDNLRAFHIAAPVGADVASALSAADAGHPADGDDYFVSIDWIKAAAGAAGVAPTWSDEFAGMVAYAGSNGWLAESADAIRAHVARS